MVNDQSSVTISIAMLNCLKQVLYSKTEGVDLSPIVEDLGGDDRMAIAVALAYKGIKPEIDDAPRFTYYGANSYVRFECVSYSIIMDCVTVSETCFTLDKETQLWKKEPRTHQSTIGLPHWLGMTTSEEYCRNKVREYLEDCLKKQKK
jgi:hypothetical protein